MAYQPLKYSIRIKDQRDIVTARPFRHGIGRLDRPSVMHRAAALILAAGALAPLAGSVRADTATEVLGPSIVVNGGFERGADPVVHLALPPGSPLLEGWTIFGPEAAVVGTGWQAEEGKRSLSLANPSTSITTGAGVKQTLTTTAGQKYRVVFYQAGNPNDHQPSIIRAQMGTYTHDYTYQADAQANTQHMAWVKRTFVYTATGTSTLISLTAAYTPGNDPLGLDNVQVRAVQSSSGTAGTPAVSATKITVGSPTVAVGGVEALTVSTTPGAALVIVVDYPDATQAVTQAKADSSGRYSLSLTVPASVTGTVHVLVDSAGTTAKASFTVR